MRRADGVLLDWGEVAVAEVLARIAVAYLERRNGTAPPGALQLRDDLAASARGKLPLQVSPGPGSGEPPAAVIVEGSGPAEIGTAEAASVLGISPRAVRDLCQTGALIATRSPAGHWRIGTDSAAALAARRETR